MHYISGDVSIGTLRSTPHHSDGGGGEGSGC